jgi:hypothetical protein
MTTETKQHEPGTEGFYLDDKGQKRDEDFHGDCQPGNPAGYNAAMWDIGLKIEMPPKLLESIYGPRPEGIRMAAKT